MLFLWALSIFVGGSCLGDHLLTHLFRKTWNFAIFPIQPNEQVGLFVPLLGRISLIGTRPI